MQIKVKGLVTAGRLRELSALIEAGAGIACYFDGNLRLDATAAADDEPPIEIPTDLGNSEEPQPGSDQEGEEDSWNGPLPAYLGGVMDNSPKALERRRLLEVERQRRAKANAEATAQEERLARRHEIDKQTFKRLTAIYGQQFIDAINAEIADVWAEVKPVYAHVCKDGNAGQPRLMPQLELRGETVFFHGFNLRGTTIRIVTPLSMPDRLHGSTPVWKYAEWVDHAVPRIRSTIDKFASAQYQSNGGQLSNFDT